MPTYKEQSTNTKTDDFSGNDAYEIFEVNKKQIQVPYKIAIAQRIFIYGLIDSLNQAIDHCRNENISAQIELPIVTPEFLGYLQKNYGSNAPIEDIIKNLANPVGRVASRFIKEFDDKHGKEAKFSQQTTQFVEKYNDTCEIKYQLLLSASKPLSEWKLIITPTAVEKLKLAVQQSGKIPNFTSEDAIIPEEVFNSPNNNNSTVSHTPSYSIKEFIQFGPITVLPEIGEFQIKRVNGLIDRIEKYSNILFFVDEDFLNAIQKKYIEYADVLYDSDFKNIIKNTVMRKKAEIETILRNTYEALEFDLKEILAEVITSVDQIGFNFKIPELIANSRSENWQLVANPAAGALLKFLEKNKFEINTKIQQKIDSAALEKADPTMSSILTEEYFSKQTLVIFKSEKAKEIIPIMINLLKQALEKYKANENLVIDLMDETAIEFCEKHKADGPDIMMEMAERTKIIKMMIGSILGGTLETITPAEKLGVVTVKPKKEPRWDTIVTKSNGQQEVLHKNTPAEERALQRQLEYGNNKWFLKGEIEHSLNIDEYVTKGYKLVLYLPCAKKLIETLKESVLKEQLEQQQNPAEVTRFVY